MNNADPGILLVGAGGHAAVIADIVLASARELVGFADSCSNIHGQRVLGYPVIGDVDVWQALEPRPEVIIAIGSNVARRRVAERLQELGATFATVIHPTAIIAREVQIGPGSVVMAGAVINPRTTIGSHCIVNTGATIDHDCSIADFVHVAPGCTLCGTVSVGEGGFLGAGTVVTPNRTIHRWATSGAGAVVVRDIPKDACFVGVPAKSLPTDPTADGMDSP